MMRWLRLAVLVFLTACGKGDVELSFDEWWVEGRELEFAITEAAPSVREDLPVLPALTGERKAGDWLLDTGARYSAIDQRLAESLAWEVVALPDRYGSEMGKSEGYVMVAALEVGGCLIRGARMRVVDLSRIDAERPLGGVIGQDILKRTVLLMQPGDDGGMAICKPGRAFSQRWREWIRWHPGKSETFELALDDREGLPFLEVAREGMEEPAWMLVDTGSNRTAMPEGWMAEEAHSLGDAVALPVFSIGGWTFRNLKVVRDERPVLGYPAMRDFLLAIDGPAGVMRVVVRE